MILHSWALASVLLKRGIIAGQEAKSNLRDTDLSELLVLLS